MVNMTVPVVNLKELIAYVKAHPGQLKFSSGGNGTVPHLAGELLNHMAGLQMVHIPYKGGAPAGAAMLGGEVQMYIDTATGSLGYIKAGKVRVLGVAAKRRTALLPDVPTVAEAGLAGYEVVVWYGLLCARENVESARADALSAIQDRSRQPDVRTRFAAIGTDTVGSTPRNSRACSTTT